MSLPRAPAATFDAPPTELPCSCKLSLVKVRVSCASDGMVLPGLIPASWCMVARAPPLLLWCKVSKLAWLPPSMCSCASDTAEEQQAVKAHNN